MPKVGMRPKRERQLIEAARAVLREEGFARTTMMRVAKRAGLSTGTVQHYFTDKSGLLHATMARLVAELVTATLARLRGAEEPLDRLDALVTGQFTEEVFTPETIAVWHVLWGNMRELPQMRHTLYVYDCRAKSNLRHTLRRLIPPDHIDEQTDGLLALTDGLWIRAAQAPEGLSAARARAIVRTYIANQFAGTRPYHGASDSVSA